MRGFSFISSVLGCQDDSRATLGCHSLSRGVLAFQTSTIPYPTDTIPLLFPAAIHIYPLHTKYHQFSIIEERMANFKFEFNLEFSTREFFVSRVFDDVHYNGRMVVKIK